MRVAVAAGSGCGRGDCDGARVGVFAAASLAAPFGAIAEAFERSRPGTTVDLSTAGTPQLLAQVEQGAPADVLVTADEIAMDQAVDRGLVVGPPVAVARNRLAIVVRAGNPRGVRGLADLADPRLLVALCADSVPAGRYARQVLERAGVRVDPVTLELSVTGVVGKVALGEVDAGIAYQTDVGPRRGEVEAVAIPDGQNVVATYPMARTRRAPGDQDAADAFMAFVLGGPGRGILADAGFLLP